MHTDRAALLALERDSTRSARTSGAARFDQIPVADPCCSGPERSLAMAVRRSGRSAVQRD